MLSLADFIAVALVIGGHDFTNPNIINIQTMHSWVKSLKDIVPLQRSRKTSRYTLQETNIIVWEKQYHRLKHALGWDMLVSRRVC